MNVFPRHTTADDSKDCTCNLEPSFMAYKDGEHATVEDCEGETVCACPSVKYAMVIAAALNAMATEANFFTACLAHPDGLHSDEAREFWASQNVTVT